MQSGLLAQCTYSNELTLAPLQSYYVPLEITGILNDDLADPNQGICGVLLDFDHQQIGSLTIELISPSGQVITLVGPAFGSALTNFSNWDVGFLPCGSTAIPDPGFNPQWTNLDPWGIFSSYSGNYYPNIGCLEDFNSGPVNGNWTLHIVCNNPFYSGTLYGFTLIFCDPAGLDCVVCEAAAGEFPKDSVLICDNGVLDSLDFVPQYGSTFPDPAEYSYQYLLSQNGTILDTSAMVNFVLAPGDYLICGLSYRIDGIDSLPVPGDLLFILNQDLQSQDPRFCGDLSDQCTQVTVRAPLPITDLQAIICDSDSVLFDGNFLNVSGLYRDTVQSTSGCDSIIQLNLQVLQSNIAIVIPDTLGCGLNSVLLDTIMLSNFPPTASINWKWLDSNRDSIDTQVPLSVANPGWYYGEWTQQLGNTFCVHLDSVLLLEFPSMLDTFTILGPDTVCLNQTYWFSVPKPLEFSLLWDPGSGQIISESSDSVLVLWNSIANQMLCVSVFSDCDTVITCKLVFVASAAPVFAGNDSTVCGLSMSLNALGIGHWYSSDAGVIFDDINDPQTTVLVPVAGSYLIEWVAEVNCALSDTIAIKFIEQLEVQLTAIDSACLGSSIIINIDLPLGAAFDLWLSGNNTLKMFTQLISDTSWTILPLQSTWVIVDSIAFSGSGFCKTFNADSLWLTIGIPATAQIFQNVTICADSQDTLDNQLNFFDLVLSGDNNGAFANLSGNPIPGFPANANFTGKPVGPYDFSYTTSLAQAPCQDSTYFFTVYVKSCACPILLDFADLDLCNADSILDLEDPSSGILSGAWQIVGGPITDPPVIIGAELFYKGKLAGDYILKWRPDNPLPLGCRDSVLRNLHLFDSPNAGMTSDLKLCVGIDSIISLSDYLSGEDLNGIWAESASNPKSLLIADSAMISMAIEGAYIFYYIVDAAQSICKPDTSQFRLDILPAVDLQIDGDSLLNCDGSSILLTALSADPLFNVKWFDISAVELATGSELQVSQSGSYIVTGVNSDGCIGVDTLEVQSNSNAITDLVYHLVTPNCSLSSQSLLIIDSVEGGIGPYQFSIDQGPFMAGSVFQNLHVGLNYIAVRDSKFCDFLDSFEINSSAGFVVKIEGEIYLKRGEPGVLHFESNLPQDSIQVVEWYQEDKLICNICVDLDISPEKTTVYQVKITSKSGCVAWASIRIFVNQEVPIFVPDGFSPNGDGFNDLLFVNAHPDLVSIKQWYIFDRWGDLVFAIENGLPNDPVYGWDGTLKGRPMNDAVFTYILVCEFSNGDLFQRYGDFILIR
ncbi:MAG: gliding motility-associated C-terminal domain-containing protein [Saprospiraceae bacterium]